MEKILLAIDSQNLDENAVDFACFLTRLTDSKLTAIFLDNLMTEEELIISQDDGTQFLASATLRTDTEDPGRRAIRDENIGLFLELIESEGIEVDVCRNEGAPLSDVIAETRFADLLVLDAKAFSGAYEGLPTRFVKDILQDAGCPVVIAPAAFEDIDNVVFCYDGGRSSIFAMKQFSYLFPELTSKKAQVINLKGEALTKEEASGVDEWLKIHFGEVEWYLPEVEMTTALFNYLLQKKNDFLVMGAYGSGLLASFFERDAKEGAARTTSIPIFVAHY